MKQIAAILCLMSISLTAFAECPDLSGNYTCIADSGDIFPIEFTQTIDINGNTVYNNGQTDIIADGQKHPYENGGNAIAYLAFCSPLRDLYYYKYYYQNDDYTEISELKITRNDLQIILEINGTKAVCTK